MPSRRTAALSLLTLPALARAAATPEVQRGAWDASQAQTDQFRLWQGTEGRRLVLLLPPFGGDADYYRSSKLPQLLAVRGIDLAVLHTHATGFLERAELARLDRLIGVLLQRYARPPARVAIGGFSAGGFAALRYAQWAAEAGTYPPANEAPRLRPVAAFSVDAPLDLVRWYEGLKRGRDRLLAHRPSSPYLGEMKYLVPFLEGLMGGSPERALAAYEGQSVFSAARTDGGNARWLRDVALRLYTEPDAAFFVEQGLDWVSSNSSDQLALTALLRLQGHHQVSLVLTQGRGIRPELGNARMPHAWSIVDEPELADWLDRNL
ncbi:MAG: hypothetical protein J0L58_09315 [Burkholderiales bacterium]|nr:hypothetical protein [Burkholderiales bacterium]